MPENRSLSQKVNAKFLSIYRDLLKSDSFRYYACKIRWWSRRKDLKVMRDHTSGVASDAIEYNLSAFAQPRAAFGMGKRMSLLLFPAAALLRDRPHARVLIIGPRTEDDILWAHALGMHETRGLDLFSYSELIDVGDMHATTYASASFDAVLFGWVLAYSKEPEVALKEAERILKPGGYLGVGMEAVGAKKFAELKASRPNSVNCSEDLKKMVHGEVAFVHDPHSPTDYEMAIIFQIAKT